MTARMFLARVEREDPHGDTFLVRAPVVGIVDQVPCVGTWVNPLETICNIQVLGRRLAVKLPHDVAGRVVERLFAHSFSGAEFGQPLMRLSRCAAQDVVIRSESEAAKSGGESGLVQICTPSHGVFYRRSGPDSPPYVEVGSPIATGVVLGLVEVMKCFTQITYGGPGLPERGKVAEILVTDASEVTANQVLMLVRAD